MIISNKYMIDIAKDKNHIKRNEEIMKDTRRSKEKDIVK